jgi:hypothetical protein
MSRSERTTDSAARAPKDAVAHGVTTIPRVVSAEAFATVASRPWTQRLDALPQSNEGQRDSARSSTA